MEQAVTVEVKLVGFDGDGYLGVTLGVGSSIEHALSRSTRLKPRA